MSDRLAIPFEIQREGAAPARFTYEPDYAEGRATFTSLDNGAIVSIPLDRLSETLERDVKSKRFQDELLALAGLPRVLPDHGLDVRRGR